MRREAFFSGDSPYEILVRSNMLLHRQAPGAVAAQLATVLDARLPSVPIRVLDLACGVPITIAEMMAGVKDRQFHYTGVDINPDQVAKARAFPLPDNVAEAQVIEGSAWDLGESLGRVPAAGSERPAVGAATATDEEIDERWLPFDLVYVGLNWHHGTPEEIWFLATQLRDLIAGDGVLVNHDCYRPDATRYLRRPDRDVVDGVTTDLRVVAPEVLAVAGAPAFDFAERPADSGEPAWRHELIDLLADGYRSAGGDAAGVRVVTAHSWIRDYPVSLAEVRIVLGRAGFDTEALRYGLGETPLAPFTATVTAKPRRRGTR